ncbi:hypothetical protein BKA70DRAFT_1440397 [Coprinopsis sp. MPI-PUGE-AT-0042]|nr:hypothetical protein BKA70DRAFT_1440397 [Coprinopsis sp. MPI-PUGE-AT-0042]
MPMALSKLGLTAGRTPHPPKPSPERCCCWIHYCDHTNDGIVATTMYHTTSHLHLSSQTVTPKHSNEWPKRQHDVRGIPIHFLNHHALLAKRVPLPPRRPRNGQLTLHCRAHSSLALPPHRRGDEVARRGAFHGSDPTHLDQR